MTDVITRAEQWHQQHCSHRDRDGLTCLPCAEKHISDLVAECRRLQELNEFTAACAADYLKKLEAVEDWKAKVTVALRRPGGAFYDDVPKHVRDLVDRAETAEASLVRLRAEVQEKIAEWRKKETVFAAWDFAADELQALLGETGDGTL